jgi:hypothetical protein
LILREYHFSRLEDKRPPPWFCRDQNGNSVTTEPFFSPDPSSPTNAIKNMEYFDEFGVYLNAAGIAKKKELLKQYPNYGNSYYDLDWRKKP